MACVGGDLGQHPFGVVSSIVARCFPKAGLGKSVLINMIIPRTQIESILPRSECCLLPVEELLRRVTRNIAIKNNLAMI